MEVLSYYSVMCLILTLVWILMFITKPELRREMFVLSILSLFLLPVWVITQTTGPDEIQNLFHSLSFLDLLFLFSLSGISSSIYHIFFGKHYTQMPKPKRKKDRDLLMHAWILGIFFGLLAFVWLTILFSAAFHLATPIALLIAALIVSVYIVSHRHDLLGDVIWSAVLTGFLVFIVSSLGAAFTDTTPAIPFIQTDAFIQGASLDLIYWALALGLVLGPMYEFIRHKLLK